MAIATGSTTKLYYAKESVFGEAPATGFQPLRFNSTSLALTSTSIQSGELRGDRQISDFRNVTGQVTGNVVSELSMNAFDDLIAAALCSGWMGNGNKEIRAGVQSPSFTIVRYTEGVTNPYAVFTGCQVNSMTLDMKASSFVTITFDFLGKDMQVAAAAPGTLPTAGFTAQPMDALRGAFTADGNANYAVTEFQLVLENGIAPRYPLFNSRTIEQEIGLSNLTGSCSIYLTDNSIANRYTSNTQSAFVFQVTAPNGTDNYTISLPKVMYSAASTEVSGPESLMLSASFQAVYDDAAKSQVVITRSKLPS